MSPIRIAINELVDGFRQSKWLPLITAYAALTGIIGPGIHIPLIHLPLIAIGVILALRKGLQFNGIAVLLLLYLPLNLAITQPDIVFRPWQRLALFSIVFASTSPMLYGHSIGLLRKKILMGTLLICVLLGFGSLICYFIGINYMPNQWDGSAMLDFRGRFGYFGGLLIQSIILGMVCGLGILYLFYRSMGQEKRDRKWYYLAMVILALTILISASRSALLSVLAGMLVMLYKSAKTKGRFMRVLIGILLIGILTYPLWEKYTIGIEDKSEVGAELGAYGSRTEKWTTRIIEFSEHPLFGIGFASVDKRYDVVGVNGVVEPGSSWLCILSMTGIVGFILFIIILIKPIQFLRSNPTPYNVLLLGLLAFFCIHMLFEGYIFAGGSSLCFMAWLVIGCCNDARYA